MTRLLLVISSSAAFALVCLGDASVSSNGVWTLHIASDMRELQSDGMLRREPFSGHSEPEAMPAILKATDIGKEAQADIGIDDKKPDVRKRHGKRHRHRHKKTRGGVPFSNSSKPLGNSIKQAATTSQWTNSTATSINDAVKNLNAVVGISVCILVLIVIFAAQRRSLKSAQFGSGVANQARALTTSGEGVHPDAEYSTEQQSPSSADAGVLLASAGTGDSNSGNDPPAGGERRPLSRSLVSVEKDDDDVVLTSEISVKGLKFLATLFVTIALTRLVVCEHFKLQCDARYTLALFMRQDLHKVVLDIAFLFVTGRMGSASPLPVDSVAFALVVLVSAMLPSWWNELNFMKHSLSMYEMHCQWSAATWLAAGTLCFIIFSLGIAHLWYFFCRPKQRCRTLVEFLVVWGFFVLPRAFEPSFHMHHWYVMWLLALPCRAPTLWSRGTQAFLIGGYVNGIACYGRDPVLACQAAFDLAYNEQCQFYLQCTFNSAGGAAPAQLTPPDWWTCQAGDYA